MYTNEAGLRDLIGGVDGTRAEAQMRDGAGAGLLGIIDEIALSAVGRLFADDLDRVLIGATVPSAPRPQNTARTTSSSSVLKSGSIGRLVLVTSSLMPTVK